MNNWHADWLWSPGPLWCLQRCIGDKAANISCQQNSLLFAATFCLQCHLFASSPAVGEPCNCHPIAPAETRLLLIQCLCQAGFFLITSVLVYAVLATQMPSVTLGLAALRAGMALQANPLRPKHTQTCMA